MNLCQIASIKEIDRLLQIALDGEVDNLEAIEKAKKLTEDMIEFKDFDTWKFVQD